MLVRVFYQTWPWEAVGRVIETGQYRAGRYRTVPPEPGALMPASNSSSMQAPLASSGEGALWLHSRHEQRYSFKIELEGEFSEIRVRCKVQVDFATF